MSFLPIAYLQHKFVPFEEANISIATHALHYGTAAFGGLRATICEKDGEILLFRLPEHCKRLAQSAKFLDYKLEAKEIQELLLEFVRQNRPKQAIYIRPLVYTSDLGISPRIHNLEKDLLIYGLEFGNYLSAEGIKCCFSSWTRQSDASMPMRGKISGSYITSALAKSEAVNRGFDEAIFLNSSGKVCEASAMNIFMVRDGKLITPPVTEDILEGITRKSVIEIAKTLNLEVVERQIDKTELIIAEEVFLTGTAAKITPITQIESYFLPIEKPITRQLQELFSQIVQGQNPQFESWIRRVQIEKDKA